MATNSPNTGCNLMKFKKTLMFGILVMIFISMYGVHRLTLTRKMEPNYGMNNTLNATNFDIDLLPIDDFKRYPCLGDISMSVSRIQKGKCVRTILQDTEGIFSEHNTSCFRTRLRIGKQTDICTYDPQLDLISRFFHKTGAWEKGLVNKMLEVLSLHPDLIFMDIGCNIGVYTLSAAMLGRQVICLDANYENLDMVSKSLTLGQLWANTTLIWNAVSNQTKIVQLNLIKKNIGASRIGPILPGQSGTGQVIQVQAILLDDLRPLVRGKKEFMKVDLEEHELFMFQGAKEFFKEVDLRYLQMELTNTKFKSSVVEILENLGCFPFGDHLGKRRLLKRDILKWPVDLYFIKQTW